MSFTISPPFHGVKMKISKLENDYKTIFRKAHISNEDILKAREILTEWKALNHFKQINTEILTN